MLQVSAIMKRNVVSVAPADTVAEAVRQMSRHQLGAVVVIEGERLQGIFSERDLLERVIARGFSVEQTLIREVMTPNPVAVFETTSIRDGTRLVREHGFRHLPVINSAGRLVGILSARDFLRFVVRGLEHFIEEAWGERHREEMTDPYDCFVTNFEG